MASWGVSYNQLTKVETLHDIQAPPQSGQLQHHSLSLDTLEGQGDGMYAREDVGYQEEETSLKG